MRILISYVPTTRRLISGPDIYVLSCGLYFCVLFYVRIDHSILFHKSNSARKSAILRKLLESIFEKDLTICNHTTYTIRADVIPPSDTADTGHTGHSASFVLNPHGIEVFGLTDSWKQRRQKARRFLEYCCRIFF